MAKKLILHLPEKQLYKLICEECGARSEQFVKSVEVNNYQQPSDWVEPADTPTRRDVDESPKNVNAERETEEVPV